MIKIKLYLFIFFIIVCNIVNAQNYKWIKVNSPTQQSLNRLVVVDSMTYFASGDTGVIIKSTDAGQSWIKLTTNINNNIIDLSFANKNYGWAIIWRTTAPPFGTSFLKTTDGGSTWNLYNFLEDNIFFHYINFKDTLHGYIAGEQAFIYKSEDGGYEWKQSEISQTPFSHLPILRLEFYNDQYGFACGGQMDIAGIIWKTTDFGSTWKATIVGPEPIQKLKFIDSLTIFGVGGDYEYGSSTVISTDGGANWEYTSLNIYGIPPCLSFQTNEKFWSSLGFDPYFIYSSNKGKDWEMRETPDSSGIYDIAFIDSSYAIAVGKKGAILRYIKDTTTNINLNNSLTKDFELHQNYPNPFNPKTTISYEIPFSNSEAGYKSSTNHDVFVSINIYDMLGRVIQKLVNANQKPGKYSIEFDGSNLSTGLYFCELFVKFGTSQYHNVIKMSLIK